LQNKIFDFKIIPEIVFGNGASEKVGAEARKRGGTKAWLL